MLLFRTLLAQGRARPGGLGLGRRSLSLRRALTGCSPVAADQAERMLARSGREAAAAAGWADLKQFARVLDGTSAGALALGGHRGMGANVWHPTSATPIPAPFRENTLLSFQRAVQCGASFLEFDVQVTRDGVPVIWHDNYVVFGEEGAPTSALVADLTADEFRQLAPINYSDAAGGLEAFMDLGGASPPPTPFGGSPMGGSPASSTLSLGSLDSLATSSTATSSAAAPRRPPSRGRLLRKHKNSEPALPGEPTLRAWRCEQEDHFPTLAEVFAAFPAHVAFDIEIKMATPDDLAVTPAAEVDRMVTATLAAVDAGLAAHGPRGILFSSFDPDVCLEVKRRRPGAFVMLLSGGGVYAHADPRRTSVAAALEVAAEAGLEGVILNTLALRAQPEAVEAARARGLLVMTYGLPNDDPDWVRAQHGLGVHGVIVDDVAGVAAALSSAAAMGAAQQAQQA